MMRQRQQPSAYALLASKLRYLQLAPPAVEQALQNLPPDTAAELLCQCLDEEAQHRHNRRRRALVYGLIAFGLWLTFNLVTGIYAEVGGWVFLVGPLLVGISLWLSTNRHGVLRHNALIGLGQLLPTLRDPQLLPSLCRALSDLDGKKRPWEAGIEGGLEATVTRLLLRLPDAEAAALPEQTLVYLRGALAANRPPSLQCAALLTLGSAKDPLARPLAESLLTHTDSTVQEAARECLKDLEAL